MMMRVERVWAMPHKYTFSVPVIASLLKEEMSGDQWADPFCGLHSPAHYTNDADETVPAMEHLDGLEFLKTHQTASLDGVLFDPPYSTEQALRTYKAKYQGTAGRAEYWARCFDEIGRVVKSGGTVISFGWNSNGVGKKRGFAIRRILLIAHGACHPFDTIVTVDTKI